MHYLQSSTFQGRVSNVRRIDDHNKSKLPCKLPSWCEALREDEVAAEKP